MRFEDITVKFIEGTERPYKEELNIYKIDAENLEEMDLCPTCGAHLKKKSKGKRTIYDYRLSPFTGEKHAYRINLTSQRYVCTNPDCRSSFTAGLLDRSKSSRAFSKLVVQKLLDKERLNYTEVGKEFDVSHTFIADVVRNFSLEFNLHFSPSQFCKYLYLHEFIYQSKPRYCLISVNNLNEKRIVGFFGYEDPKRELADYLRFHLKDGETWFTIATENAEEFAANFEKFPGQVFFVETQKGRNKKLHDKYVYKTEGSGARNFHSPYADMLNTITGILKSPNPHQKLKEWWLAPVEHPFDLQTKQHFDEFVSYLLTDGSTFVYEYGIYTATFKDYEKDVLEYNRKNLPFERMCLHMMHKEYKKHKKHILTDVNNKNVLYDEQNNVIYRPAPLEDVEKLKEEAHRLFELYRECDENGYDDYFDESRTYYEDEIPENVIQEIASRYEDTTSYSQPFSENTPNFTEPNNEAEGK